MSERFNQLSARHRALLELSARQRTQLSASAAEIHSSIEPVDRALGVVRRLAHNPLVLVGGAAVLALIGPRRLLNITSRGLLMLTTARQALHLAKKD